MSEREREGGGIRDGAGRKLEKLRERKREGERK